jgi:hypothetical protein
MALADLVQAFVRKLDIESTEFGAIQSSASLDCNNLSELAISLRSNGIPVQELTLDTLPDSPAIGKHGGQFALFCRKKGDNVTATLASGEELGLHSEDVQLESIVCVPPIGQKFKIRQVQQPDSHDHEIALFYSATNASRELAHEQLIPDLEALRAYSSNHAKKMLFVDSVGLIPEEVVHRFGLHDADGFRKALSSIRNETSGLRKGHATYNDRCPLWNQTYVFLAEHQIEGVTEELPFKLWKQITHFDRQHLAQQALSHFVSGQIEEASELMARYLSGFHDLNCARRNEFLAQQLIELLDASSDPVVLIILREIGHYGSLEALLTQYPKTTKILGYGKFTNLIGPSSYSNFGVQISESHRRLTALRYCLKSLVAPIIASGLSYYDMAARLADTSIENLCEETVDNLLKDLHHPTRVFLRSTPHDQDIQYQLLYLLRDRGIMPSALVPDPAEDLIEEVR